MNPIAMIILLAISVDLIINAVADRLNLRALREEPPESFRDIFDPERYRRSQAYLRANTRFGWVVAAFDLTVLLIFWFGKGFHWLEHWSEAWGRGPIVTGFIFIGCLLFVKALFGLPFDAYRTFVIEQRFGFNRTRWSTFTLDKVKGLVLAVLLGGPLLAVVLGFFNYAGARSWWICWVVSTLFVLAVQFIAPRWIMPLFNKFELLAEGELKTAILDYARSIGFCLQSIFVMDGSKRSSKANAFFTGFGRHRRIVLFDTLIASHTVPELLAVLAHEMGHFKKKHILKMLTVSVAHLGLMFGALSVFISYPGLFEAFFVEKPSVHAGLVFFALLYSPMDTLLGVFSQILSRRHEYEADRFAVLTTGNGAAMIQALKKLSVNNLSNLQPHPFYVFLHYSHPPVLQRIEAIERTATRFWTNTRP
jgi:STE24 endopeptidase